MVVCYLVITVAVDQRFKELESQTRLLISDQQTILAAIAETTARNGADAVTESVVRDCPNEERNRFDTLLGSLNNGLNQAELVELERLFGRCGSFFAERKSVMVSRLNREVEVYSAYVNQLNTVTGDNVSDTYNLEEWQKLATEEQKLSTLFSELVVKQDEIISTLLTGSSPQSQEIITILREVNEIQETLAVTNAQINTLRTELIDL